ncbi:MAG: hypothetical protein ABW137_26820 [Mycobacterium sp.]
MKKFGFTAIVAGGLMAGVLGLAAPAQATVPTGTGFSAGIDRQHDLRHVIKPWVDDVQTDRAVQQIR